MWTGTGMNRNRYEPEPGFKDLGLNRTEPNRGFDDYSNMKPWTPLWSKIPEKNPGKKNPGKKSVEKNPGKKNPVTGNR